MQDGHWERNELETITMKDVKPHLKVIDLFFIGNCVDLLCSETKYRFIF